MKNGLEEGKIGKESMRLVKILGIAILCESYWYLELEDFVFLIILLNLRTLV